MQLSKSTLPALPASPDIELPSAEVFSFPEKVIQFGTGVLLRGLVDYFIDEANRQGIFRGRVVVVKSTEKGGVDEFAAQNGLFTHAIKGFGNGRKTERTIINSSISRVLSAVHHWQEILQCAADPEIRLIVSNTTEVGIALADDDVLAPPPRSFPGKLLALLYARFEAGLEGFVIVPTELIPDNGTKLKEIVIELARRNLMKSEFIQWIEAGNVFCNSLVDRIVPGKLADAEKELGYRDELAILSEPYRLWAIESSDPRTSETLTFRKADTGLVIASDITRYRELKLRMLNGTHTMSCGVAALTGIETVREGMQQEQLSAFISRFMMTEVAPAISGPLITAEEARAYGESVLDRFRNPFIQHRWLSITLQYSSKMKMRNVPLLLKLYEQKSATPTLFAFGFAAFLLFMKSEKKDDGTYYGLSGPSACLVQDDNAAYFHQVWQAGSHDEVVHTVLSNYDLWGADLSRLAGFEALVSKNLSLISSKGMKAGLEAVL